MITEIIVISQVDECDNDQSHELRDQDGKYLRHYPTFEEAVTEAHNLAAMHSLESFRVQIASELV